MMFSLASAFFFEQAFLNGASGKIPRFLKKVEVLGY